jgi:hypothetical protein
VPRFYFGKQSIVAPSQHYMVEHFSLGLEIGRRRTRTRHSFAPSRASPVTTGTGGRQRHPVVK